MRDGASSILEDFRQGDVNAFETLFRLHQRDVYGWVLRIVRNPSTAEDVSIEAFWRIHQAHARFDPSREFAPWARTIATHAAIDWMRTRKAEPAASPEMLDEVAAPREADPALTAEICSKTTQAFNRLPPRLRSAAILAVIEERPHKEVAEALGISVAAVKLRVFRALRQLRKDLQQQGITP